MANSIWVSPFATFNGSAAVFTSPVQLPDGSAAAPSLTFGSSGPGWYRISAGVIGLGASGTATPFVAIGNSGIFLSASNPIAWSATADAFGSDDVGVSRLSAGVLGIGNGNAGSFAGTLKVATINATTAFQINGVAGANFGPGAAVSLTIVNGIVTAAS